MFRYLFTAFILLISYKSDQSNEFQVKLKTLLEEHLKDPKTVNLVVKVLDSGIMLQFIKEDDLPESELHIVGHPKTNNLKKYFTDIEILLDKNKLTYYNGSTKNVIYVKFNKKQIGELAEFSNDFFQADFVNADFSKLIYSYGYRKGRKTVYSDEYNLLQQ